MKKIIKWFNDRRDRRLRERLVLKTNACHGVSDLWEAYEFVTNPIPEARHIITQLYALRIKIPTLAYEVNELIDKRYNEYRDQRLKERKEAKGDSGNSSN